MRMKKLYNPWVGMDNYHCFGCNPGNPMGLQMTFYEDGDDIVSVWCPLLHHQSWINTLHGGVQAALLDEICGWVIFRKFDSAGVTGKMELRYRRPVSTLQSHIVLRARLEEQRRNVATVHGEIWSADGVLCAECTCLYFIAQSGEKNADMGFISTYPLPEEVTLEEAAQAAIASATHVAQTTPYRPLAVGREKV